MENFVFLAILFAAACHAGWNALIKVGLEPLTVATLISVGSGVAVLAFLPVVGLPAPAAWPWLLGSVAINLVYLAALSESYRTGDLGQIYPIARGAAPPMTALAATLLVGEHLGPIGWSGIAALVVGVFLLSARGAREMARIDRSAVGFALFTAVSISAYSVVDGIGARLSGSPNAYSLCLFVGVAMVMLPYALSRRGWEIVPVMRIYWRRGLVGGALQLVSYSIAVWAMTKAPIAVVAALRETSVLFGAVIAVVVLKEPLRAARIAAALLIVCGLALLRLK